MIGITEKAICRKVARTFETAAQEGFHPVDFTIKWLCSDTCRYLYELNCNEIAQSYFYQLNSLKMELNNKNITIEYSKECYPDEMYWAGYLFTYWMFFEKTEGTEIASKYEIERIISCYDTLHTLSCEVAINECQKEFKHH